VPATESLSTSAFDYDLPGHLIAQKPPAERGSSRLLYLQCKGKLDELSTAEIAALVRPGDVWVFNDTKVLPARLMGRKATGGRVEILLLKALEEKDQWLAWGRSNRPVRVGERLHIADGFEAEILGREERELRLQLLSEDVAAAIAEQGHMPLPPYIARNDEEEDRERYQTVYARHIGAVAAPTAGLHFTTEIMAALETAGASIVYLTLHVGPGTFQPVSVERIEDHVMHEESYHVSETAAAAINAASATKRRIVAVGTTSLRALEAAGASGKVQAGDGCTRLFITPGYRFRLVDALMTNFHLPRSTLLMLTCAFAGRGRVMAAYEHAKRNGFRFFSYGDAMFIEAASG